MTIFIVIPVIAIIVAYVFTMIGSIFYFKRGYFKKFYHDVMGWHQPRSNAYEFDGLSFHGICKYCGKEIMQDSQGNWFG